MKPVIRIHLDEFSTPEHRALATVVEAIWDRASAEERAVIEHALGYYGVRFSTINAMPKLEM